MKRHSKIDPKLQGLSGLPLFDWRAAVHGPKTPAGDSSALASRFLPDMLT
jgi:hypothetical protein